MRKLQKREGVVALADAERRRVAYVPRFLNTALLPFPVRENAGLLAYKVNAGLGAELPLLHEVVDAVNANLGGEPVVVDVG